MSFWMWRTYLKWIVCPLTRQTWRGLVVWFPEILTYISRWITFPFVNQLQVTRAVAVKLKWNKFKLPSPKTIVIVDQFCARKGWQDKVLAGHLPWGFQDNDAKYISANQFYDREGWQDGVFTEHHQDVFQDNEAPVSLLVSRTNVAIGNLQSLLLSW